MDVTIGILGMLVSLALLVYLAFRGHSVIVIAPIVSLIAVVAASGADAHLMVNYTETYMSGFATYVKNYFPLYLLGAIFAKLMEDSGNAAAIAEFITSKLGTKRAMLSVVLACSILTYGGVSLFVVAFVILPIAINIFKKADVPKRLMPGALALGSLTFTMTALPGSPQVQNTIPMQFFGTDSFAAPVLGFVAAIIMFGCGMFWLNGRVRKAKALGEGYGDEDHNAGLANFENLPNIVNAFLPVIIIITVNLFFSKVYYPSADGAYLADYGTTMAKVSGTWSVLLGMIFSIIFLLAVNFKRYTNLKMNLKDAAASCLLPLINSCAVVGFGSVMRGLAVFAIVQSFVLGISSNLLISEFLAVNLLCGMMASASGGLGVTLEALAPVYLEMASETGMPPEVLHRVASVSSGGLDSLPHNGATVTILALCKKTHKESYLDMFMVSVVFPILASVVIIALASVGVVF